MKTGFKDPTEIKEGNKVKNPWSFECPPYDERSSCFVNAGTHYGVGHRQPVGTTAHSTVPAVPNGRPKTLEVSKVYKGRPGLINHSENE